MAIAAGVSPGGCIVDPRSAVGCDRSAADSGAAGCGGVYELAVPIWMELPGGREIVRTATFDGESRSATARVENVATRPLQVVIDRRGDLLVTVAALAERP